MKLSQVGELSLLEQIRRNFTNKSRNILVNIGDDAAVLKQVNQNLLVTTDMMVEGVHFDLHFMTPYQLGFKLVSVNISDIYAMGGNPRYMLLNIAVNRNTHLKFIDIFFDGLKDALNFYNTILIGGDISSAKEGMSLSATLIGYARKYIQRSGACEGDKIYVTGNLGDSACGLELLKRIRRPVPFMKTSNSRKQRATGKGSSLHALNHNLLKGLPWNIIEPLIKRHLMPEARDPKNYVKAATSMIDISDGLQIDLLRLCTESELGARIYEKSIPVSYELKKAASYLNMSAMTLALSGGEDYELLFTAPAVKKVKAIHIGYVIKSGNIIVDNSGNERIFSAEGYQHFGVKR
jgi:thiamine-monophosphate kinase